MKSRVWEEDHNWDHNFGTERENPMQPVLILPDMTELAWISQRLVQISLILLSSSAFSRVPAINLGKNFLHRRKWGDWNSVLVLVVRMLVCKYSMRGWWMQEMARSRWVEFTACFYHLSLKTPFMRNGGGQSYINFKEALAFFSLAFKRLCAALWDK